jgi:hypothetical protein
MNTFGVVGEFFSHLAKDQELDGDLGSSWRCSC